MSAYSRQVSSGLKQPTNAEATTTSTTRLNFANVSYAFAPKALRQIKWKTTAYGWPEKSITYLIGVVRRANNFYNFLAIKFNLVRNANGKWIEHQGGGSRLWLGLVNCTKFANFPVATHHKSNWYLAQHNFNCNISTASFILSILLT